MSEHELEENNGVYKTLGLLTLILAILGSLAAIFQQQINSESEKTFIAIEAIKGDISELSERDFKISDRLRDHVENSTIHYGGLADVQGRINVLEEKIKKCQK